MSERVLSRRRLLAGAAAVSVSGLLTHVVSEASNNPAESPPTGLERLPWLLPPEVELIEGNAVAVSPQIEGHRRTLSGVVIRPDTILTALHGFRGNPDTSISCNAIKPTGTFITGYHRGQPFTRTSDVVRTDPTTDIALIQLREPIIGLPEIPFAPPPRKNTSVYCFSYQPTTRGYRDPYSHQPELRVPAIYGGVFLGTDENGRMVMHFGKSYGAVQEIGPDAGASGGMIVTREGIVGMMRTVPINQHDYSTGYAVPITRSLIDGVSSLPPDHCR